MIQAYKQMLVLACSVGGACPMAWAQHAGDIWIGRSAEGRLRLAGFDPQVHYIILAPIAPGGLFQGWSDSSPGFDRVTADAPEQGFFRLAAGAAIHLEVVSLDPALRAIDTGFQVLDAPGERTFLGNHNLHAHLTWHLNSADAAFDARHCVWQGVFLLRDLGSTGYEASDPLLLRFVTRLPIPADFDCDGDVDLDDYAHLAACSLGPAMPQTDTACRNADLDDDWDVDQEDFGMFQGCYSGAGRPAMPECLQPGPR